MRIQPSYVFLLFLFPFITHAQYTDKINTNRPGVSQGAFSVGTEVLQFESGFSLGNEKHELLKTDASIFNMDYSIRYGFLREELEISLIGAYQRNSVTDSRGASPVDFTQSNFKSNTIGLKYLVYDPYRGRELEKPNLYSWKANNRIQWADLIPAVAVYAGANLDFADNPFTPEQEGAISPKIVVSTQNNFIGGFVLVTNIIADRVTTDFPSYGYIVTLTHATNAYFSIFIENQGFKSDFYADQLFRGGVAALITDDLHVDLSFTANFKDTPSVLYGRLGAAYRFDLHKQDEFIEEKGKAGRVNRRAERDKKKAEKEQRKKNKKDKNEKKENNRKGDFEIDDDGSGDDGGDDGGL